MAARRLALLLSVDASANTQQLRNEYNRQIKKLHPDAHAHLPPHLRPDLKPFLALRDAWDAFNKQSLGGRLHNAANLPDGGFTAYGVGCSFADSDAERDARARAVELAALGKSHVRELPGEKVS